MALLTLALFLFINRAFAQDVTTTCLDFAADQVACEASVTPDCTWNGTTCTENITPATPAIPSIEAAKNQVVNIANETEKNWQPSGLQTYATRFLIRAKEALTWSLNIEDAGFHNPAIQTSYAKVLTIVNSLFILGMLAIAAMWMFSIFIPRRQLRKVMLVYAGAVIFINFALPVTRLLIDSTNLLQKTLLVKDGGNIAITDIVQTDKTYAETVGYVNTESATDNVYEKTQISIPSAPAVTETGIGKISDVALNGSSTGTSGTAIISLGQQDTGSIKLDTNTPLTIESKKEFFPESESAIFTFAMVMLTGIAYFTLALIFILRIIILWALLILSPALILLAIFKATRGWFINWLAIYGRWLLIGPLVALGIAIIVNIWKVTGEPPIKNAYGGETFADNLTNISFMLPGSKLPNTLKDTKEMMEYIVFLMMLYIPIFFAFALTRQKVLRGAAGVVVENFRGKQRTVVAGAPETEKPAATAVGTAGVIGTLKDIFSSKVAKITETALPAELRAAEYRKEHFVPSASNFLPEQLALTSLHGMMELLGASNESRHSRDVAIERLASPKFIADPREREKHESVRNEIEKRATSGDPEASTLMNEIREKQASVSVSVSTPAMGAVSAGAPEKQIETREEIRTEAAKTGPLVERVKEETTIKEKETVTRIEEKPVKAIEPEKKKPEEEEKKKEEEAEKEGEEKEEKTEEEKTEAEAEGESEEKKADELPEEFNL